MAIIILSVVQCPVKVLESYFWKRLKSIENKQNVLVTGQLFRRVTLGLVLELCSWNFSQLLDGFTKGNNKDHY